MEPTINVEQSLLSIRALAARANSLVAEDFDDYMRYGERPDYDNTEKVEDAIETAFLQLLNLAESLKLSRLVEIITSTYQNAKSTGLSKNESFEGESAWSHWSGPIQRFADSIGAIYGLSQHAQGAVSTDLLTLLYGMQSAITDKRCFQSPEDESEVHDRIETILKCVYPDLLRKPPVAKAVVNFIPDSGIRSIGTLLEYKFMSNVGQAGQIANQILADTRGFTDSGWDRIVFVIYETRRFKSIHEWRQLLRESGVPDTIEVVLIHGEPPPARPKKSLPEP